MNPYTDLFTSAAQKYEEDPLWLQAIAQQESAFGPTKVSPKGASGIMQLMPDTAKEVGVTDVNDPAQNIQGGAQYYSKQRKKYNDPNTALMAYNWGPKNVDDWVAAGKPEDKVPAETREYVRLVNDHYKKLKGQPTTEMTITPTSEDGTEPAAGGSKWDRLATMLADDSDLPADAPAPKAAAGGSKWDRLAGMLNEDDAPEAPPPTMGDYATDVAKTIPSAVGRGLAAIPQIPAMAGNLVGDAIAFGGTKAYNTLAREPLSEAETAKIRKGFQPFYTGNTPLDAITQAGNAIITGEPGKVNPLTSDLFYDSKTTPGRLTGAAVQGAIAGPATGGSSAVMGALSGASGQAASEAYPNNPIATLAGGLLPTAAKAVGKAAVGKTTPEMAEVAKNAQERGINIPPGLMSDSPLARRTYSLLNRFGLANDNTPAEFTGAVAKTLGLENTNKLTNSVMADAKKDITSGYGRVAEMADESGGVGISDRTLDGLQELKSNAVEGSPRVDTFLNKLTEALDDDNKLSADSYKKLTQTGSFLDNLSKSEKPELRDLSRKIENLLQQDLSDSVSGEARKLLNETDKKYALWNLADASRDDVSGLVNPNTFSSQAWKKNANYFKSEKNLRTPSESYTLANIADQLKLLPSSGTAENAALMAMAHKIGGVLGSGGVGYSMAGGPGALLGTGAAVLGGKALGSALSSNWYRNMLIEKASQGGTAGRGNALLNYGLPASASINATQQNTKPLKLEIRPNEELPHVNLPALGIQ